ncbi:MAG TPA: hypothetical protein DC048_00545 [Planctomycetaceae bacterium]|nr:hypothetical protein [Planctomycetaceae bacterium]
MADAPVVFATVAVAAILDLRHRVLRAGRPFESARFEGDDADTTRHYAALLEGEAVACLTLMAAAWKGPPPAGGRGRHTSQSAGSVPKT